VDIKHIVNWAKGWLSRHPPVEEKKESAGRLVKGRYVTTHSTVKLQTIVNQVKAWGDSDPVLEQPGSVLYLTSQQMDEIFFKVYGGDPPKGN